MRRAVAGLGVLALAACGVVDPGQWQQRGAASRSALSPYDAGELEALFAARAEPLVVVGDIDADGRVTSYDVTLAQALAGPTPPLVPCAAAADTQPDGVVDSRDVTVIQQLRTTSARVLMRPSTLPCSARAPLGLAGQMHVLPGSSFTLVSLGAKLGEPSVSDGGTLVSIDGGWALTVSASARRGALVTVTWPSDAGLVHLPVAVVSAADLPDWSVALAIAADAGTDVGSDAGGDAGRGDGGPDAGDSGVTDGGCPWTRCAAAVVSLFTESYATRTTAIADPLRAAGCTVREYDAYGRVPEYPRRWCAIPLVELLCNMTKQEEATARAAYQGKVLAAVGAAGEALGQHRADIPPGVKVAFEYVAGHGTNRGLGTDCGGWSTKKGDKALWRQGTWELMYGAVNGRACHWSGADFSCMSGWTADAWETANNTGGAYCGSDVGAGHPGHALHAARDDDAVVTSSSYGTCTFGEGNAFVGQVAAAIGGGEIGGLNARLVAGAWAGGYGDPGKGK